jgi:ubiquitin C-terminal hydrolase
MGDKKYSIKKFPKVLCLQLKRFVVNDNRQIKKITSKISIAEKLNLQEFSSTSRDETQSFSYKLLSYVEHQGSSIGSGHYTGIF